MATTGYITIWCPVWDRSRIGAALSAALVRCDYEDGHYDDRWILRNLLHQLLQAPAHGVTTAYHDDTTDTAWGMLTCGAQIHGVLDADDVEQFRLLYDSLVFYRVVRLGERMRVVLCTEDWDDDPDWMAPGWTVSVDAAGVYDHLIVSRTYKRRAEVAERELAALRLLGAEVRDDER